MFSVQPHVRTFQLPPNPDCRREGQEKLSFEKTWLFFSCERKTYFSLEREVYRARLLTHVVKYILFLFRCLNESLLFQRFCAYRTNQSANNQKGFYKGRDFGSFCNYPDETKLFHCRILLALLDTDIF